MSVNLYAVTFDCADAAKLAGFWSAVLGRVVDDGATEDFAAIGPQDTPGRRPLLMFVHVPEAKAAKNRFHPDLIADDLEGEVGRLVDLGAVRKADFEEGGARWATLCDPEGNEFDVVAEGA
ncbi:MAG: VOC family protein [Actinomycetota bacterium]|nr:VOC family protein [Actinomycetota bacterium]